MATHLPSVWTASFFESTNSDMLYRTIQGHYELELHTKKFTTVINNKKYNIKKGDLTLLGPDDTREDLEPFSCHIIHFMVDNSDIVNLIASLPKVIETFDFNTNFKYFDILHRGFINRNKKFGGVYLAENIFNYLCNISQSLENKSKIAQNGTKNIYVKLCKDYIDNNYSNNISILDIANACFISKSYLHKIFLKYENITPLKYLTNKRIEKAKLLLISTNKSIIEVAHESGFGSQTNFYVTFKNYENISPIEYRNAARSGTSKNLCK